MVETMRAARMHEVGGPMRIDEVPRPTAFGSNVVVEVATCGMVPNLGNVLKNWPSWCPHLPQPELPAIFGLDPAGTVTEVGENVIGIRAGDRVYVSPVRSCGACPPCLDGKRTECRLMTFGGYFGFQEESQTLFDQYPHAGFGEFMLAPAYSLVKLPDNVSFEDASRLGYLGTAYSALKKAGHMGGKSVLINGGTGTLGIGAVLFALALGATKVMVTARNRELLARVRQLDPRRVHVFSTEEGSIQPWVRSLTDGGGADYVLDTLGAVASLEVMKDAMLSVRRGGRIVNIGGTAGEMAIDVKWLMDDQIAFVGSVWFTTAEGYEMVEMMRARIVDITGFEHRKHSLDEINEAINGVGSGDGGFTSYMVTPR
ncbi:MAG: zinc-binding dehydrogenase [Sphingomonadaceae bacterium]|nr:zinc-binding dehydrogenase [Sphingomonadaceae bacterium]